MRRRHHAGNSGEALEKTVDRSSADLPGLSCKNDLCRFAVTREGVLVLDKAYRLDGRGAYACLDSACIQRLLRNTKKLHKAFRRQNLKVSEDLHAIFRSGE